MTKIKTIKSLEAFRKSLVKDRKKIQSTLVMCGGTGCQASRCQDVIDAVKNELDKQGLAKRVCIRTTGCHGFCEQGPLMVIEPQNIFYCHISPDDAHEIVAKTIGDNEVVERLLYIDPVSGKQIQTEAEIPFGSQAYARGH